VPTESLERICGDDVGIDALSLVLVEMNRFAAHRHRVDPELLLKTPSQMSSELVECERQWLEAKLR
jgi:hypothetical protein